MSASRLRGHPLALSGGLWFLAFLVARVGLKQEGLSRGLRIGLALAPFAWFLAALGQGLRALDELERRIQLEALALAFPLAMILLMAIGFLELAVPLSRDNWSFRHVWAMLPTLSLLCLTLARRRNA